MKPLLCSLVCNLKIITDKTCKAKCGRNICIKTIFHRITLHKPTSTLHNMFIKELAMSCGSYIHHENYDAIVQVYTCWNDL